ncbi:MAG TPA: cytochrome b/b6 domain-containing protein [Catalimonadaceae bacterium]|nr:cytochrome b/b6 domain-containing protein [Catalimonadaceae bacterium]
MSSNQSSIRQLHPAWLRILHWVTFYTLLVMVWSGMLIYWAYPAYKIGSWPVIPKSWFNVLGLESQLANGLAYHFNFMWILMGAGFFYLLFSTFFQNWKHLVPVPSDGKRLWQMGRFALGLEKEKPVEGKYNPAQKLAYFTTILALALVVASGWAIYKPARLFWMAEALGGYRNARFIHFSCTVYLVLFFVVHVIQVVRAGWRNFSAMVTGGTSTQSPNQIP